jgi:hypothetical protein
MKAPIGKSVEKILDENKYDYFFFRSVVLPERLQKAGYDVEAVIVGTDLKYMYKGKDITEYIEKGINDGKKASLAKKMTII